MIHSTLGEKITFLVTEFYKNPQPFIAKYKLHSAFTHSLHDTLGYDQQDNEYIEAVKGEQGGVMLGVGQYYNTCQNERWQWLEMHEDIIVFAPQSTYDNNLSFQNAFNPKNDKFELPLLNTEYGEDELFQYSTVMSNAGYETLELFLYLKEHCKVPFRIDTRSFSLDLAMEIYK